MTNKHTHTLTTRSQATHALVYVGRSGDSTKPTISGYAHSEAAAKARARRERHLVVCPIVDGKVTVLKNADELLADPEALQSRANAEGKPVRLYEAVGALTTWVGAAPGGNSYVLKAEAFPTKPTVAHLKMHTDNVTATDKRVAMLTEMVQACEIIAARYEDKRNEVADLRERLASATQNLNDAVSAAIDAGLTFEQIDKAAKHAWVF